jgi:hypothetical protein
MTTNTIAEKPNESCPLGCANYSIDVAPDVCDFECNVDYLNDLILLEELKNLTYDFRSIVNGGLRNGFVGDYERNGLRSAIFDLLLKSRHISYANYKFCSEQNPYYFGDTVIKWANDNRDAARRDLFSCSVQDAMVNLARHIENYAVSAVCALLESPVCRRNHSSYATGLELDAAIYEVGRINLTASIFLRKLRALQESIDDLVNRVSKCKCSPDCRPGYKIREMRLVLEGLISFVREVVKLA